MIADGTMSTPPVAPGPGRPRAPCHFCGGYRAEALSLIVDNLLLPACRPCKTARGRGPNGRKACAECGSPRDEPLPLSIVRAGAKILVCATCHLNLSRAPLPPREPDGLVFNVGQIVPWRGIRCRILALPAKPKSAKTIIVQPLEGRLGPRRIPINEIGTSPSYAARDLNPRIPTAATTETPAEADAL